MQLKKNLIIDLPGLEISPVNRVVNESRIIDRKWSVNTPRAVTVKRTIVRVKGKRGRRELDSDLHPEEERV